MVDLRCLTLMEPYASLMACGAKQYETRSFKTHHRGWIGIHSSQRRALGIDSLCRMLSIKQHIAKWEDLPRGSVIAVGELVATYPTGALSKALTGAGRWDELDFGDWTPGRSAWQFQRMFKLPSVVHCKGMLGLWRPNDWTRRMIINQLPGNVRAELE